MRVFLSYGRADAKDLAGRLAADLAQDGHSVWIDQNELRSGRSWEEQIERAILACDAFVALLSPHAVRRPDGVCLDEISLARYSQRRIIPAMVLLCRPPLGIYRLDWIDFQDWARPGRYEQGLARLRQTIAAADIGVEGESAVMNRLRPLDFGSEISRLSRGFTGREWLLAELSSWLAAGDSRVFLVTGDPGTGKSAVIARLVERHPRIAAYHMCVANLADSLDPVLFVRSIAAQLRSQLPNYRGALDSLDFESLPQSDSSSLFRRLLADPLRSESPSDAVILAVDALDESLAFGPRHIARLLSERLDDMPPWLRLVLTTRKEPRILDLFSRFCPREIDAASPENLEDIRSYLDIRLTEPPLRERLRRAGIDAGGFAKRIAVGGAGNFLYVTQALAAIEAGRIDLSAATPFPDGLVGIYDGFFSRLFPEGAGYDAVRPVLEVLVSAREPLAIEEIAGFLDSTPFAVAALVEPLAAFFPERNGRYAPFHKSVIDWLTGLAGHSRRFQVDRRCGDLRIAKKLLAGFKSGQSSGYALSHLPAHLLSAGLLDDTAALLGDLQFLEAKCAAGLAFALVADFNAALARPEWPDPDRQRLAAFARFIQYNSHVLARRSSAFFSMAANEPDESPLALAARDMIRTGRERRPWLRWLNKPQAGQTHLVMRFLGTKGFFSCSISPDGRMIAAGADDGALMLWDAGTGALLGEINAHAAGITACPFFPDGRRLATASNDASLKVWDLASQTALFSLQGHSSQVKACALSADGSRIASAGEDGCLIIWDAVDGKLLKRLAPRDMGLYACAFSPDGRMLACGGRLHQVIIFDVESGSELRRLGGHEREVRHCVFSRDGRHLLTASADETLRLWDLVTGSVRTAATGHAGGVNACTFLNRERWILSAGAWDARLKVWDVANLEELAELKGHSFWIAACAAHPDDRHAVSAATDMTVCCWDVEAAVRSAGARGAHLFSPLLGAHAEDACGVEYFPDGSRLVSLSRDGTIKLWDVDKDRPLAILTDRRSEGIEKTGGPPGNGIVSVAEDGRVRSERRNRLFAGALSPDGERFVSAGEDGVLRVWRVRAGVEEWSWPAAGCPLRACAIAPDGLWLASGGDDGVVRLRTMDRGSPFRELRGHQSWIVSLGISPNGKALVSGSYDGTLRIWDAVSGEQRFCMGNKREPIFATAISPDGTRIAAVSQVEADRRDVTLRIWDLASGWLRLETAKKVLGLGLAFSPDGRWLAYAGFDRHLKILDPEDGREVTEHRGESKPCSIAWHPDGRHLAVGCMNGGIQILLFENTEGFK